MDNKVEVNEEEKFVDLEGEDNPQVIASYFADGMSKKDYKKTIKGSAETIKKTGPYKKITYDFESHLKYSELEGIFLNLNNSDVVKN